jgi:hypothetical protein
MNQKLQTFLPNKGLQYFRVRCNEDTEIEAEDLILESLLENANENERQRKRQESMKTIGEDEGHTEESPWLTRTGWKRSFAGKNMDEIVTYVDAYDGREPELSEIRKGVERMIDHCISSVRDLDQRGWNEIRFWLRSHERGVPHVKPFRNSVTELAKYKNIWTKLIFFCWRTVDNETVEAEFLPSQLDAIRELRDAICLGTRDETVIDERIFRLSVSLIHHSDFEREKSVIKCFAGIMGYDKKERRWKRPNRYTPVLAGIQFCMRVILLEDSLPLNGRDMYQHGIDRIPLEVFQAQHSRWLVDGSASPYSWVHKLLNYGMTAAKEAKGEDRTRFSADGKYCYFEGHGFKVEDWKTMVKDVVREMENVLSRQLLFLNSDTIEPMNPYQFVDHEYIHERGHYFAQLIPEHSHQARKTVLSNLKRTKQNWRRLIRERDEFDAAEVASYTRSVQRFLELLLLAINWTCGQTGRGTEMMSLLYKNKTSADRNIFVQDGQIMIVTSYHKSQAVTEDIKVRKEVLTRSLTHI